MIFQHQSCQHLLCAKLVARMGVGWPVRMQETREPARLQLCLASRYNNFDVSTLSRESHKLILAIFRRVNAKIGNIRIYFSSLGARLPRVGGGVLQ